MIHINYQSDFQTKVNIKDKDGNIIAPPSVPWEVVFYDEQGKEFACKHNGGIYTHCLVDGNDIVCFVNNPCFCVGKLRCSFVQHIPSGEYCDGTLDLTHPLSCDIMLWKRESDDTTPIILDAYPNWVKGDKGDKGEQGERGEKGDKGDRGLQGADGYSPTARVVKAGDTATITITDKNGTTTAQISDGARGADGADGRDGVDGIDGIDGADGADGFSPIVETSKTGKVTTITITDANGTHTATINDGEDGKGSEIDAYTKAEADGKFVDWVRLNKNVTTEYIEADDANITEVNTNGVFFEKTSIYEEDGKLTNNGDEILTIANNPQEVYIGSGTPPTDAKIAIDPSEDLVEIVQEQGSATDKVMSQKAVTDALANIPSGGGDWELIEEVTIAEPIAYYYKQFDSVYKDLLFTWNLQSNVIGSDGSNKADQLVFFYNVQQPTQTDYGRCWYSQTTASTQYQRTSIVKTERIYNVLAVYSAMNTANSSANFGCSMVSKVEDFASIKIMAKTNTNLLNAQTFKIYGKK